MADTNDIKCNLIQGVSIAQHNLQYACNKSSSDDVVFINRKTAENIMMVLDNVCKFLLISKEEK